jgi:hypothetical protein
VKRCILIVDCPIERVYRGSRILGDEMGRAEALLAITQTRNNNNNGPRVRVMLVVRLALRTLSGSHLFPNVPLLAVRKRAGKNYNNNGKRS